MSEQAVANFVSAVAKMFPVKHESEDAERDWLSVLVRELASYKADVLGLAASEIMRTRRRRDFPLPSEIHDACATVLNRRKLEAGSAKVREGFKLPDDEWSRERLAWAYESCRTTELGKKAAREKWISRMFHYCRVHQRLPDFVAVEKLRREAAEHRKLVAACQAGKGGTLSRALGHWGEAMLEKEARLAAEVLSR